MRGKVLVEDVNDCLDQGDPLFTFDRLIQLLYEDVLMKTREITADKLSHLLLKQAQEQENYFFQEVPAVKQHSPYHFEIQKVKQRKSIPVIRTKIKFSRKNIYRGEVLLHDLSKVNENFNLSLEEVIVVRYLECMKQVQKNNPEILRNILSAIHI